MYGSRPNWKSKPPRCRRKSRRRIRKPSGHWSFCATKAKPRNWRQSKPRFGNLLNAGRKRLAFSFAGRSARTIANLLNAGLPSNSEAHLISATWVSTNDKVLGGTMNQAGKRLLALTLVTLMMLAFAGCPTGTTIGKIQNDPSRFYGKEVGIKGRVTSSFGALGNGVYEVDDGTGKLWVLSEGYGVPGKGAEVKVVGRIVDSVNWGGRNFGTAMRQTERR